MRNSIVIVGAGGHGRVVADTAVLLGYTEILFLDDADDCCVEIAGKTNDYVKYIDKCDFFVAIGNPYIREKIIGDLEAGGANIVSLIHPSAVIGSKVVVGNGSFIAPGAIVNTGVVIGRGVIINTASSVDHDCRIDDFCHISVGSHLAGTVMVGKRTFVGAGSTIINNLSVCQDCVIGAGAVVVKNITECGTYIGVPTKKLEKL